MANLFPRIYKQSAGRVVQNRIISSIPFLTVQATIPEVENVLLYLCVHVCVIVFDSWISVINDVNGRCILKLLFMKMFINASLRTIYHSVARTIQNHL